MRMMPASNKLRGSAGWSDSVLFAPSIMTNQPFVDRSGPIGFLTPQPPGSVASAVQDVLLVQLAKDLNR